MAQHKASTRRSLQSAFANAKLADTFLNTIYGLQTFALANGGAIPTKIMDAAVDVKNSPYYLDSSNTVRAMRSALANKKLADHMLNILFELQGYSRVADKQLTSVVTVAEGSVKEVSEITADSRTNTVDGQYFDIDAQAGTLYRLYMDTTGGDLTVPIAGGRTLTRVDISGVADTAAGVGDAVAGVLDGLADFSCPATGTGVILCTDANYGDVADVVNGDLANAWAFANSIQGVDSALDGKYFLLEDAAGTVGIWFDVDDSGTVAPAGALGADRALEITTVTSEMTKAQVGDAVYAAVIADSEFEAGTNDNAGNLIIQNVDAGFFSGVSAGDSGFTVAVSDGGSLASSQALIIDHRIDIGSAPYRAENLRVLTVALTHATLAETILNMILELQVEFRDKKLGSCSGTLTEDLIV